MIARKPLVLILCTGNSCRSQIAEGFLRHYQGEKFDVASAGTEPKSRVHPLAVKVMQEASVDIRAHAPKPLTDFLGRAPVRHLIIVCNSADGSCPRIWPGTYTREFQPFDDPADFDGDELSKLNIFRRVRDEIDAFCKTWQPKLDHKSESQRTGL